MAYDVLRAVDDEEAYANLELIRRLRSVGLSTRDAALATELVGGTLRMRGAYDAVLDQLVRHRLEPPVRDALRLGVHQLLSTRVSTHAAVTTTVDLVRRRIGHRPTGMTNAVLRKVAGRSLEEWLAGASLDVRYSHPSWIVSAFEKALGDRADELPALLAADNERPLVHLAARPGLATVEELLAAGGVGLGGSVVRGPSPVGVVLEGGDPGAIPAVREGRAGVQDAGSQLVTLALVRAEVDPPGLAGSAGSVGPRWLDVCAGPGGKAALLGALATQAGARLLAGERQPHRATLVVDSVRAVPDGVLGGPGGGVLGVVVADGTQPPWRESVFDRVLVDAPCTGLGALRRRPEARWRRRAEDVGVLAALQADLLDSAIGAARPGGVVGYVTCSPVVEETADVVREVLRRRADAVVVDAAPLLPEVTDAASPHLPGAVQLWPHRHGTDAMFLALLRRTTDPAAPSGP